MPATAESSGWKGEGPTIRLGMPERYPAWARVDAPTNVVQSASQILAGNPSQWRVNNFVEYGKRIVCLGDDQHHRMVYLALPEGWILLSQPQGVPYINMLLESFFATPHELEDPSKLVEYIQRVASLFKGSHREVLSHVWLELGDRIAPPYLDETKHFLDYWLGGSEKNPEALRSLCSDPIVRQQGGSVEIQCNVITTRGSVEKWMLTGKLGKTVTLTDIAASQIRPDGTFSYPGVPGD